MSKPIKVFFTGGGGAGTIEAVKALKALGYAVVTADATASSAGFSFADRSYVIPFGADDAFIPAFREILRREQPDFVVPLVDEEIPKIHRFARAEMPELKIVGPTLEFSELVLDKWAMANALAERGLSVARTWLASDAASATYPAIVKPRQGRGSRGLAFLDGPADLRAYLSATAKPADAFIVQERLVGPEYTTSVITALDGTLFAIVPKEAADKRGITQVGITRSVPAIDELCRKISADWA